MGGCYSCRMRCEWYYKVCHILSKVNLLERTFMANVWIESINVILPFIPDCVTFLLIDFVKSPTHSEGWIIRTSFMVIRLNESITLFSTLLFIEEENTLPERFFEKTKNFWNSLRVLDSVSDCQKLAFAAILTPASALFCRLKKAAFHVAPRRRQNQKMT